MFTRAITLSITNNNGRRKAKNNLHWSKIFEKEVQGVLWFYLNPPRRQKRHSRYHFVHKKGSCHLFHMTNVKSRYKQLSLEAVGIKKSVNVAIFVLLGVGMPPASALKTISNSRICSSHIVFRNPAAGMPTPNWYGFAQFRKYDSNWHSDLKVQYGRKKFLKLRLFLERWLSACLPLTGTGSPNLENLILTDILT